jgi:pimeloyl-ACP methyl ester carboxylesterase
VLFGVSFGGALALQFAARNPQRLGGLVVQGADVRFERTLLRQVAGRVLSEFPLPADNAFVNQFFNLLIGERPRDRNLFDFVTRQCWETDQSVIAHRFRLAEKLDLEGRLASVRVPALVLTGERDVLVSSAGLRDLRQTLPDAEFATLPGAGHLAFVTHPDLVVRHVLRFAEQHGLITDY